MNDIPLRIAILEPGSGGVLHRLLEGRGGYELQIVHSTTDLLAPDAAFDLALVDPELEGQWPAAVAAELIEALNGRLILCCRSAADAALIRQRFDRATVVEQQKLEPARLSALLRAKAMGD
jgi:hypothetical protein